MRFTKVAPIVLSALVVLGFAAAPASAQRFADAGGVTLANGTPVLAGPSTLAMTSSMGTFSCSMRLRGTVASASTLSPVSLDISGCTDTIPLFNYCSATATAGPATALTATATGGTVALTTLSATFTFCGGIGSCTYGASLTLTQNNAANTWSLSQVVPRTAGVPLCVASANWATTLTPVWADINRNGVRDPGDPLVRILP